MVFGYTPLDPLVVLLGTLLAVWYLSQNPLKLLGFMPVALSLWFFVPLVTNLTLWQTVPLLLTARIFLKGIYLPKSARPVILILLVCLVVSSFYALAFGADAIRASIRIVFYSGVFATFVFAYEMGRKPEAYEVFLKGFVVLGAIYAVYGVYQIFAFYTGLPLRGIVYSASGGSIMAFEGGLLRINSFANEPKRLGYVLFLSAVACFFLAQIRRESLARKLKLLGVGIFGVSILTFAGSYFLAIALFVVGALLMYPSRAVVYCFCVLVVAATISILIPELGVLEAIQHGYEERAAEVEVGLDGAVVYRQEFYAWDYLASNPLFSFTGVGIGQYFSELNKAYGVGVGFNEFGGLVPLNSNFLEMLFDLGAVAATLFYGGLVVLIFRLRKSRETFFCLSLLFLLVQSLTILNLLFIALFAGVAMGRLSLKKSAALEKPALLAAK